MENEGRIGLAPEERQKRRQESVGRMKVHYVNIRVPSSGRRRNRARTARRAAGSNEKEPRSCALRPLLLIARSAGYRRRAVLTVSRVRVCAQFRLNGDLSAYE